MTQFRKREIEKRIGKKKKAFSKRISLFIFGALNYANAGFGAVGRSRHKVRVPHFHMAPEGRDGFELVPTDDAQISLV